MHITLRQLEVFAEVLKSGSTTQASQMLALSQSAVSAALTDLEGQLGVQLFDRVGKRLVVNEHGRLLYPRALALLEQLPAGSKVLFLPGSGDPSPYATTAHASLSPYADWAQALIDAGVTLLDVPVSFTREKSTIWFVPEDLYTLNIPSARKAYQKQLDGLNALPTLTADQAALQRLAVYQLDRLDRIEAAMAEMTNKDMQVCVSGMPLTQEYITTAKQNADPKAVCAMK